MLARLAILSAFGLSAAMAIAGPRVEIFNPQFNGTGCPAGSASINLGIGAKKIDINFDRFSVKADNLLGQIGARKECNATFNIKVPHGYSVAVNKIKYHATQHLPFGSNAHFVGNHYLNHEPLTVISKRFYGQSDASIDISTHLPQQSLFWSPCGEEVVISSRTFISVSSVKSLYPASIEVDEYEPGLSYYLFWRSCVEQRIPQL